MRRERFDKINVVPFIDIVLVLLVIVLATASFINEKSVKIDLPGADESLSNVDKKTISISINKEGKYFYEKTEMSLENLHEKLKKIDPKKDRIELRTDKNTKYENFSSIIIILKEMELKNVGILYQ